jgi:hypothetical protein
VTTRRILPTAVRRPSAEPSGPLDEQLSERFLVDDVPEPLDPVDLDDGYPLAILPLERGIGRDIDDGEVAFAHGSHRFHGRPAEMAAGRRIDDDAATPVLGYG